MIPLVGLIVAAYACARLLQVPVEHSDMAGKWILLLLISICGILAIVVLAGMLLISGVDASLPKVR